MRAIIGRLRGASRIQVKAIQQVSRQLKLAKSKQEIYGLVMDGVKETLGYTYCAILELEGDFLEVAKERGYTSKPMGEKLALNGKGITVASLSKNEPLYIPDLQEDERYIQGVPGARCEYAIPITIGEDKYGVLNIENKEVDSIPPEDRDLLQILASELAVALKSVERLRQIDEWRLKLNELHHVVDRLQQCKREQDICQVAVEAGENILGFDFLVLYLVEGTQIVPKAVSTGLSLAEIGSYGIGEGIAGQALRKDQTIWGKDVRQFNQALPFNPDFRAFMIVPIGDLGVLEFDSTEVDAFSPQDVTLAEILANHLREEIKRIRAEEELRQQAIRDPLTGLYNRRYFNQTIQEEVARAKRYHHSLGFLLIDINRFKEVNDRYSHLTGDRVLEKVADLIRDNLRQGDLVIRYGGDEFLIVLPETEEKSENIESSMKDKLCEWNRENQLIDFPLTLAIGTSYWNPEQDKEIEKVLKEADRKMYETKGRR